MNVFPSLLVRDAWRYWKRKPWQATLCVALLGLGSGAVAVLWTVTDTVARQPLPYPESDALYGLQSVDERTGEVVNAVALADFRDVRERQSSFTDLFAYRGQFLNYRDESGTTRQLYGARVTRGFAETLGIRPELGSFFSEADYASESSRRAVVSYDFWQEELGGTREVVGSSIWFDDEVFQVIGVMPKAYNEPSFADVWTPFPDVAGEYFLRDARYWSVVGRLRDGVAPEVAKEELGRIADALEEEYPATNRGRGATMEPLQRIIVGDYSTPLTLMLAAVSLVLFATCLNLANLQLISGLQRRGENAVRQAVGESRGQAFARALAESVAVCLVGCGLGWALSWLVLENLGQIVPDMFLPRLNEVGISGSLGVTILVIALGASLSFGLLPALQLARANLNEVIKSGESRHGLSRESGRSRVALLSGQIAVAVGILLAALLVVHEYQRLKGQDLGFEEEGLVFVTLSPGESRMFDLPGLAEFYGEVSDWMREQDAIEEVVLASSAPLSGFELEFGFLLQGRDLAVERDEAVTAGYNSVSRNFVESLGVDLVDGRGFSEWDNRESERVALVNRAFVEKYLTAGEDPLVQHVQVMPWMEPRYRRVVGVVDDYAQVNVTDAPKPQIFVPYEQTPWVFSTMMARVRNLDTFRLEPFEAALKQRYPDVGLSLETVDALLERHLAIESLLYLVFLCFGLATLGLSLFGIGSQMAFNVSERSREWGIRLALGATVRQLNLLALKKLASPLGIGCLLGIGLFASSFRLQGWLGSAMAGSFWVGAFALVGVIVVASLTTTWAVANRLTRASPQDILRS